MFEYFKCSYYLFPLKQSDNSLKVTDVEKRKQFLKINCKMKWRLWREWTVVGWFTPFSSEGTQGIHVTYERHKLIVLGTALCGSALICFIIYWFWTHQREAFQVYQNLFLYSLLHIFLLILSQFSYDATIIAELFGRKFL